MPAPRLRVQLGRPISLGPGKMELLAAIAETGSISAAARRMRMSYRRAWAMVDAMNHGWREPLVVATTGGSGGGGAELTATGRKVRDLYARLCERAEASTAAERRALAALLAEPADPA